MMNRIMHYFVCILAVTVLTSCASMPVAPVEDRSMQKVHDINLTKNEIYDISLEWMAQKFLDSRERIELKDRENGIIIGSGITSFTGKIAFGSENVLCRYSLVIEAKENKYRTTYDNFVGLWGENYNRPKPLEQKEYVDAVKSKLAIVDEDLHNYLQKYKSKTDW